MRNLELFKQSLEKLNERQKEAINVDVNAVVTAGAGTGKTTVLSYRFLRLVLEKKANADQILTLTFSRLAAKEMFERIENQLLKFDVKDQLSRLGEATITTIDSFCHRVVTSDLKRFGLASDFIMDEQSCRDLAKEATTQVLKEFENDKALAFLAQIYKPDELKESVLENIAYANFLLSNQFDANDIVAKLNLALDEIYKNQIEVILNSSRSLVALEAPSEKIINEMKALSVAFIANEALLVEKRDAETILALFEQANIRKSNSSKEYVQRMNALVVQLKDSIDLATLIIKTEQEKENFTAVYRVLERLHQIYLSLKRERAILSFGDVAAMAHSILLSNLEVRAYFKNKFRYILIDEFQDTNQLQKELIYLLAEKKELSSSTVPTAKELEKDKLFFVGDEKQSIYRFRGADVSVFKKLNDEIVAASGKQLSLVTNYRSEPLLVDFFNTLFEPIMEESTAVYEAKFEKIESFEPSEGVVPKIKLLYKPLEEEQQEDSDEQLALAVEAESHAIVTLIKEMVETDNYLINDGKLRRPHLEDIALLFRTTASQMYFEKALRKEALPYSLSSIQSLFLEAPANDLFLFLQLLIYKEDRLAYAAILRSPFCRISDEYLFALLEDDNLPFSNDGSLFKEDKEKLKYLNCKELYDKLLILAETEPITKLINYLWYEGSYRYHLLKESSYHPYLEHYDYLFELALIFDERNLNLNAFLDYLRPFMGKHENLSDVEPLKDQIRGVQVMTIHKSKGLEFPIVIIPTLGAMTGVRGNASWHRFNYKGESIVTLKQSFASKSYKNLFYEADKTLLAAMESSEMKRLFYVATTRAKNHLILSGCINTKNLGVRGKETNFLALLDYHTNILSDYSALGENFEVEEIESQDISILNIRVDQKKIEQRINALERYYQRASQEYSFSSKAVAVTTYIEKPLLEKGDLLAEVDADKIIEKYSLHKEFGTLCHLLLEYAIKELSYDSVKELAKKELKVAQLTNSELKIFTDSALNLTTNFTKSSFYKALLDSKPTLIESEVAFSLRLDQIVNGSIDLLLHYPDHLKVIDFKSDAVIYNENHLEQLKIYSKAVKALYNKEVVSCIAYLRDLSRINWVTES